MIISDNFDLIVVIFLAIIFISLLVGLILLFYKLKNLNIKIDNIQKSNLKASNEVNVRFEQIERNYKDFVLSINHLKEIDLVNFEKNVKSSIYDINGNIDKYIKTQGEQNFAIQEKLDSYSSNTISEFKELKEIDLANLKKEAKNNIDNIDNKIEKYIKTQDKYNINIQSKLDNHNFNITKLVSQLRIDNFINFSEEINKSKQASYENEYFLKIIKFIDKKTGDITKVFYNDDGEKDYTETYNNENKLILSMRYEKGKLKLGKEFDKNGNEIFEYFYDDVEEISKKIEYVYDKNLEFIKKEEVNYKG